VHGSLPLAVIWVVLLGVGFWRFRVRGLWFLIGTPAILYWPYMLWTQGLPGCYYDGQCM
jgi:hypothetical protein